MPTRTEGQPPVGTRRTVAEQDRATFLKNTYCSPRWEAETHLDTAPDFDGYQHELAELVNHVLQASRTLGDLKDDWEAHLVAWEA